MNCRRDYSESSEKPKILFTLLLFVSKSVQYLLENQGCVDTAVILDPLARSRSPAYIVGASRHVR